VRIVDGGRRLEEVSRQLVGDAAKGIVMDEFAILGFAEVGRPGPVMADAHESGVRHLFK
jgi:hypothetical protein